MQKSDLNAGTSQVDASQKNPYHLSSFVAWTSKDSRRFPRNEKLVSEFLHELLPNDLQRNTLEMHTFKQLLASTGDNVYDFMVIFEDIHRYRLKSRAYWDWDIHDVLCCECLTRFIENHIFQWFCYRLVNTTSLSFPLSMPQDATNQRPFCHRAVETKFLGCLGVIGAIVASYS